MYLTLSFLDQRRTFSVCSTVDSRSREAIYKS